MCLIYAFRLAPVPPHIRLFKKKSKNKNVNVPSPSRTKVEQIYYRTNREHQELEQIENKYFPYNRYTMPLNI